MADNQYRLRDGWITLPHGPFGDAIFTSAIMVLLLVALYHWPPRLAAAAVTLVWLLALALVAGFFVLLWWIGATYGPFIRIGG